MQPRSVLIMERHNRGGIYYVLKKGLISGSVCGITVALLLAAFPSAVSLLFGLDSPELIQWATQASPDFLHWYGCSRLQYHSGKLLSVL